MNSLKEKFSIRSNRGFTIVEILVVILIIGILLTILLLTYSGIEQHQRNSTRISDIKLIQSNLETYYAESGFYPTLAEMNSVTWTEANLKALDQSTMIDPGNKSNTPIFSTTPVKGDYTYQPVASNGTSPCDDKTIACAKYTLSATLEAGAGTFVEQSLN